MDAILAVFVTGFLGQPLWLWTASTRGYETGGGSQAAPHSAGGLGM